MSAEKRAQNRGRYGAPKEKILPRKERKFPVAREKRFSASRLEEGSCGSRESFNDVVHRKRTAQSTKDEARGVKREIFLFCAE